MGQKKHVGITTLNKNTFFLKQFKDIFYQQIKAKYNASKQSKWEV